MSSHDKIYNLLKGTLNPFDEKNFADVHLETTSTRTIENEMKKEIKIPDPRVPKSLLNLYYAGNKFKKDEKVQIDQLIEDLRASMDLPFDELYHKEKSVIQNVIEAEKALELKLASLKDPIQQQEIDETKLTPSQRKEYYDILDQFASPFEISKNLRSKNHLSEKLESLQSQNETCAYCFDYSESQDIKSMLKQGLINGKTANKMEQLLQES